MNSFNKSAVEARSIQAANISKFNSLIQKRARQARYSKREENDDPPISPMSYRPGIGGRLYVRGIIYAWTIRRRERATRQYL